MSQNDLFLDGRMCFLHTYLLVIERVLELSAIEEITVLNLRCFPGTLS